MIYPILYICEVLGYVGFLSLNTFIVSNPQNTDIINKFKKSNKRTGRYKCT